MATVRIDVEAADKASATLNKVAGEVGNLSKSAAASAGGFGKLVGNVDGMVRSLTGFSLAQVSVAGAVAKGAEMVTEAISNYSSYVEQVDHMAIRTGMATEEISRLVQVADDFRVETATLERAMTLALQNGFEPTTDNLAKLADQFVAMQDPTERAAAMQDIFGKSWADLVPLLERGGDAIRAASAGIDDSLIVTDDAVAKNRDYIAAMDGLSDAWAGVQNQAAQGLIPALTDVVEAVGNAITEIDRLKLAMSGGETEVRSTAKTYAEYVEGIKDAAKAQGLHVIEVEESAAMQRLGVQQMEEGIHVVQQQTFGYQDLTDGLNILTEAQWDGIAAAEAWGSTAREAMVVTNAENDALATAATTVDQLTQARMAEAEAAGNQMSTSYAQTENLRQYIELLGQASQAKAALTTAEQNYNTVLADFSQGYSQDAAGALRAAGVEGEKLEAALAALDEQNGTNLLGQHKANEAMEDAAKKYQSGEYDLEEYTAALGENKTEWEALDDNVQQAKNALDTAKVSFDALMADMASWDGKTFTIQLVTGGSGGGKTHNTNTEGSGEGGSGGLSDYGYGGPGLGARGRGDNAAGGTVINIQNLHVTTNNAQDLVNQLGKLAARGRASGAGYAGG